MGHIQPLSPVTIAGTDVGFAQGVKAGNWVFLTGHEATDFTTGLAPEVRGKPKFPLYGAPKHRREGDFILRRLETLLREAGTDRTHAVRLDQYCPTWKAVDPYHDARRAYFGDYIPPSTSVLMPELLHPEGLVHFIGPPAHIGHHKGGCHGEHLAALFQTNASIVQVLFDRGLRKAEEGIAPSKGLRKQFGMLLVEFLKPVLGIGAILGKPIIFELSLRQTDRAVSFSRRMRYSRHRGLDVRRCCRG